jgi:hypothetical protein
MSDIKDDSFNPMKDAFENPSFNAYIQGPGKDLDESLQPGVLKKSDSNLNCRISLKKVPKLMTNEGIMNLCSQYGKVIDIHVPKNYPETIPFIFVEYSTVR